LLGSFRKSARNRGPWAVKKRRPLTRVRLRRHRARASVHFALESRTRKGGAHGRASAVGRPVPRAVVRCPRGPGAFGPRPSWPTAGVLNRPRLGRWSRLRHRKLTDHVYFRRARRQLREHGLFRPRPRKPQGLGCPGGPRVGHREGARPLAWHLTGPARRLGVCYEELQAKISRALPVVSPPGWTVLGEGGFLL